MNLEILVPIQMFDNHSSMQFSVENKKEAN